MLKHLIKLTCSFSLLFFAQEMHGDALSPTAAIQRLSQKPGECFFSPPESWWIVDPSLLPSSVKILIKAPEQNKYPPSINLVTDHCGCDLKTYLKKIKAINQADALPWRDLGTIETAAGVASLSQLDTDTNWGQVRMMHAILVQEGTAHILTCAALKEEFPKHYETFFSAMKSLRFNKSLIQQLEKEEEQNSLAMIQKELHKDWKLFREKLKETLSPQETFDNQEFQEAYWAPFCSKLDQPASRMGEQWKALMIDELKGKLIAQEDGSPSLSQGKHKVL